MPRKKNQKMVDHLNAIRPASIRQNVEELIGNKKTMDVESDDSESNSSSRRKIERMGTAESV